MNKLKASIACALLSISIATSSRAEAGPEKEIYDLDAKFRQAMVQGDAKLMDAVIADDAKIIHGNHGGVQDKKGLIGSFRGYHIDAYERVPIMLKVEGSFAVLVSTTRKVSGDRTTETSTTEVFAHRTSGWQILVLQNTDHSRE
jgi:hypothetical protein